MAYHPTQSWPWQWESVHTTGTSSSHSVVIGQRCTIVPRHWNPLLPWLTYREETLHRLTDTLHIALVFCDCGHTDRVNAGQFDPNKSFFQHSKHLEQHRAPIIVSLAITNTRWMCHNHKEQQNQTIFLQVKQPVSLVTCVCRWNFWKWVQWLTSWALGWLSQWSTT